MAKTQGGTANESGKDMEAAIEAALQRAGFSPVSEKQRQYFQRGALNFGDTELGDRWYARNVKRFRNMYEVAFFADFVVYDSKRFPHGLVIESKQQEQAGSVDEKYVFTVLSLKALYKLYRGLCAWLVFGGAGARPVAVEWMQGQQDPPKFRFMSEAQFRVELRRITGE
jgi:hypothetical protein